MTMYLEHFGLTEAPFKITPHTEFFFSGASRGETLEALLYSITSGEGIVKVTGEVGAGKTMLCRVLMERLPPSVETIYLAVPSLSRDEMLATIAGDLGLETQGMSTTKLIRALQEKLIEFHAEGRQVVALIDEAHAMPLETLEEIRLLSNLETSHFKLMQIVLFGQPELDQHLLLQNMRQLRERITHSFALLPLPPRDIKDYVDFRLRAAGYKGPDLFAADSLRLIAEASEGLTRRINIYCDKTLLAAYAAGTHTITPDLVRAAITDTRIVVPNTNKRRAAIWLAVLTSLIAGLVIGFFGGLAARQDTTPSSVRSLGSTPANATRSTVASVWPLPPPESVLPATWKPAATPALTAASQTSRADDAAVVGAAVDKVPSQPLLASTTPATNSAVRAKEWLGGRVTADMARIDKQPRHRYSIQLMTAEERERTVIETYLRQARRELNPDRVMLYLSGTPENPKVSVLYGNYADRTEATTELASLPQVLSQFRPYARSFQAVRDDFRKSAP
ncbi:MAG: ExeA family protein [Burkholderiales bacterium]|jgi:MSHA biogenesis protein MshM|nr:AAA family ATPase [Betaproteobacteria bacterium]